MAFVEEIALHIAMLVAALNEVLLTSLAHASTDRWPSLPADHLEKQENAALFLAA